MNQTPDLLYKIALNKVPQVGAVIARNLISHCGGAEGVFRARKSRLLGIPGVGETLAKRILDPDILRKAEIEMQLLLKHDIQVHFYLDEEYPDRLRPHMQSPILLYGKGRYDLNAARMISFVGTRTPTEYGKSRCAELIEGLAPLRPVIVSGLAYGIDICAHRTAVRCGIPTLGIMGSGFRTIYPAAHRQTAQKMLQHGGLITEFDFHTGPDKENFPARNRIVATMVDAVVVIESARSGGSMITAEFANNCNKDVFALPGRASDKFSQGCNYLIKMHKAHLVETAEDVAELLCWEDAQSTEKENGIQRRLFAELSDDERLVVELLQSAKDVDIDTLAYQSKLSMSQLSTVLLSLEFKGVIRSLPGKRYLIM